MMDFLNERFPIDINYGSSFSHKHNVSVMTTQDGDEFRSLVHPYVRLEYNVLYEERIQRFVDKVLNLYDRANGKFRSFRVRDLVDFSTHNNREAPTALDMPMLRVSPWGNTWRLVKWYGDPTTPGCARRILKKPVAGTVKIAFDGVAKDVSTLAFDYDTGILTLVGFAFVAQVFSVSITSTTAVTVLCNNHPFLDGNQVTLSGAFGIPALVGKTGAITKLSDNSFRITYAAAHGAAGLYTSGGVATSDGAPIPAALTAGCEFDVPCRFDTDFKGSLPSWEQLQASGLVIVEVFNP